MALFFAELLVRGTLLCLLIAVVLFSLQRAAATYRHLLCALALGGLLALPLVQTLLPPLPLLPAPQPPALAETTTIIPEQATVSPALPVPRPDPVAPPTPQAPARRVSYAWLGPLVWALGALLLLGRLTRALRRLHHLTQHSQRTTVLETDVLISPTVTTPMTWGVRHPVIVLPASLTGSAPAVLESALRHEKAHIARWDWLWHLLAEVVCALCWFQPGAWWLRRRLRAESERACDDRVVLSGTAGPDYAAHLLAILTAGRTSTLAPGMAASGSLETRIHHILDPKQSRHTRRERLALTVALGLVLLPVAALRVAAKPSTNRTTRTAPKLGAPHPEPRVVPPAATLTQPALRAPVPTPIQPSLAMPELQTRPPSRPMPATPPSDSTFPLKDVIWNTPVDGLAAGFLLTSRPRVPLNSQVTYQVLIRNVSDKPISLMTRLLQYDGYEVPTVDGKPARGAQRHYPVDPLYDVTLAPGESVIVPGQNGQANLGLTIGEGGSDPSPRLPEFTPGHLKLTQPITIYRSQEKTTLSRLLGHYTVTKIAPDGRLRPEPANRATGLGEGTGRIDGGQTLEAYIYLEVGTLNAAAERNADAASWGKVDKGLQCGIRLINPTRTFTLGDTIEAEFLWRNTTSTPIATPIPRAMDLYPTLSDTTGHGLTIDFGPRLNLYPPTMELLPKEIRSLGVVQLTLVAKGTPSPGSNLEPSHITLAPGTYKLSGFGGVSAPNGPNPRAGEIVFTVR